jgi:aerobic carbon-monoxide dehydrogenase medium subunit
MYLESFAYHAPHTVEEALALLKEHGAEAKLLAGGHSLLPTMKLRLAAPAHLIDMKGLRGELQYIRDEGSAIVIGALATHAMLESSELLKEKVPLLCETAGWVGDMQVRNLGTFGGSIAHADPAADFPAAVLALEAEMVIYGLEGKRTVPASEFFLGFFETAVQEGDILTEIRVPVMPEGSGSSYQTFPHPASGYAICGVAAILTAAEGGKVARCRVGVTGISGGAYRATGVEGALEGQAFSHELVAQAAERAADNVEPLEDPFAGADYRRQLAKAYAKRALIAAWERLERQ